MNSLSNTPSVNEHEALLSAANIAPLPVHVDDNAVNENCSSLTSVKMVHLQSARRFGKQINDGERPPSLTIKIKRAILEIDDTFDTMLPKECLSEQSLASNRSSSKAFKPRNAGTEVFLDPSDPKSFNSHPFPCSSTRKRWSELGDESFQGTVKLVQTISTDDKVSKSTVSEKLTLQPLLSITDGTTQHDENIKSLDKYDAILDTDSCLRDIYGDKVPKPNKIPKNVALFDEEFVNCEVEEADHDISKLMEFLM